jgi:hypothetical protein
VLSEVAYHPSNINWTNYNGDIPAWVRWLASFAAIGFTVAVVSLSLAGFQRSIELTDNKFAGLWTSCPRDVSLDEAMEVANRPEIYQVVVTLSCFCR